jgi:transposase
MGEKTGSNPTDRHKAGSKHHLLVDAGGTPLNVILTGENRHDSTQLMSLLDGLPSIAGRRGRPLRKPQRMQADRGYGWEAHRQILRERGIWPQIGKRLTEHGSHLGLTRWVVERTFACGCTSFGDCACAMSVGPICMKDFSDWVAR